MPNETSQVTQVEAFAASAAARYLGVEPKLVTAQLRRSLRGDAEIQLDWITILTLVMQVVMQVLENCEFENIKRGLRDGNVFAMAWFGFRVIRPAIQQYREENPTDTAPISVAKLRDAIVLTADDCDDRQLQEVANSATMPDFSIL